MKLKDILYVENGAIKSRIGLAEIKAKLDENKGDN